MRSRESPFNPLARISNLIQSFRPSSGLLSQNKQEPQRTKPTTKGDDCAPSCGVARPAKLGVLVSLMLNYSLQEDYGYESNDSNSTDSASSRELPAKQQSRSPVYGDAGGQTALKETKKNGLFVLPGIGRLVKSKRKARMGRNPATGAAIKIPAKTVVKFRVAKAAKDSISPSRAKKK